jgi:hypothetical protein
MFCCENLLLLMFPNRFNLASQVKPWVAAGTGLENPWHMSGCMLLKVVMQVNEDPKATLLKQSLFQVKTGKLKPSSQ